MKQGQLVFDAKLGEELKNRGMNVAATKRQAVLQKARQAVKEIAISRPGRCVTADDAQRWLIQNGHHPAELGNAAGSLFRSQEWEFTGNWTKSVRVSRHRNILRIWRLK